MKTPFVVGIAGSSGAGKSTLAAALMEREPERYAVMRLDDYYKRKEEVSWPGGIVNWDLPIAIRFEAITHDLRKLKAGEAVTLRTRSWTYGPDNAKATEEEHEYTIEPKPVVVLEGFLALYDEDTRALLDLSIFLSLPIETSLKRRAQTNDKDNSEEYLRDILIPAHTEFVEPTMQYADFVEPVEHRDAREVYEDVRAKIEEKLIS